MEYICEEESDFCPLWDAPFIILYKNHYINVSPWVSPYQDF